MQALWLPIVLAPLIAREPVGQGEWHLDPDPVHRHLASLMVGQPISWNSITIVPLHARVPSEAGAGRSYAPRVHGSAGLSGKLMRDGGRWFLRVINDNPNAVFFAAGTVMAAGGQEYVLRRDLVIRPKFAAIVPIVRHIEGSAKPKEEEIEVLGLLPPELASPVVGTLESTRVHWHAYSERGLRKAMDRQRFKSRRKSLITATRESLLDSKDPTLVGCVVFLADVPVATHVFGDRRAFQAFLPSLLAAVALQHVRWTREGDVHALNQRTKHLAARPATLRLLRSFRRVEGEVAELAGEGSHTRYVHRGVGVTDALVEDGGILVHLSHSLGGLAVRDRPKPVGGNGNGGGPPPPPGAGPTPRRPDERSNGERARRTRPTKEDERLNERRRGLQPTPPGGATPGRPNNNPPAGRPTRPDR